MKHISLIAIVLFIFLFNSPFSFAKSPYVLPYPGAMPGSKFYNIAKLEEKVGKYWHFGSFAAFDYQRNYADKYLVEAKTLFEYDQYFLGYQALLESNNYFQKIPKTLEMAKQEGKDISEKKVLFLDESEKHKEVLIALLAMTPGNVIWTPEKQEVTTIPLHNALIHAINLRENIQ